MMIVAVMLSALVVAALPLLRAARCPRSGPSRGDVPARIVAAAGRRLPVRLQDWGQAMAAELPQIADRGDRWQFAVGVLRVALFPPTGHGRRVLVTALAGLAAAGGATVAAAGEVPSLTVFAAAPGLLLAGYATVATWRSAWAGWTARQVIVAALAIAGVTAAIIDVAWIGVHHSAAITASASVPLFSVVFAVLLAVCLAVALSPPRGQLPAQRRPRRCHPRRHADRLPPHDQHHPARRGDRYPGLAVEVTDRPGACQSWPYASTHKRTDNDKLASAQ